MLIIEYSLGEWFGGLLIGSYVGVVSWLGDLVDGVL
jgi:hypothetical protein